MFVRVCVYLCVCVRVAVLYINQGAAAACVCDGEVGGWVYLSVGMWQCDV